MSTSNYMSFHSPKANAEQMFYCPNMSADVECKIKTCHCCGRCKSLPEKDAPLVNITTTRTLKLKCMDFLSVENKDILIFWSLPTTSSMQCLSPP